MRGWMGSGKFVNLMIINRGIRLILSRANNQVIDDLVSRPEHHTTFEKHVHTV